MKKAATTKSKKKVHHIPEGFHTLTPYMICKNAAKALDFYKKALGAVEILRMAGPDGKIGHAEFKIGNSQLMLADEHPKMKAMSPESLGGCAISLMIYVEDVDSVAKEAVKAGMKTIRPVQDMFYGDRSGTFEDPFGHTWTISTHVEDVPPAELQKRADKAHKEMCKDE